MKRAPVDLHEARANLSRLVDEVANGAEVVIAKGGKPIAKLVPFPKDLLHAFEGRKRGT
jgi:prevent-host-death family protein